jgi:hypothetical protein
MPVWVLNEAQAGLFATEKVSVALAEVSEAVGWKE